MGGMGKLKQTVLSHATGDRPSPIKDMFGCRKAVRTRDRPKSSAATPNGVKAATARAAHPPPPPAEAPAPPPGAPVFEDVSPEEIQRLRQERAAALAAEEELILQVRLRCHARTDDVPMRNSGLSHKHVELACR